MKFYKLITRRYTKRRKVKETPYLVVVMVLPSKAIPSATQSVVVGPWSACKNIVAGILNRIYLGLPYTGEILQRIHTPRIVGITLQDYFAQVYKWNYVSYGTIYALWRTISKLCISIQGSWFFITYAMQNLYYGHRQIP